MKTIILIFVCLITFSCDDGLSKAQCETLRTKMDESETHFNYVINHKSNYTEAEQAEAKKAYEDAYKAYNDGCK